MPAPRRSTPPRTATRGRSQRTSARRDRSQQTRARSGRKPKPRRSKPPQRRKGSRFFVRLLVMAALGYGLVMGADLITGAAPAEAAALWDKLVDRLLDRDVPRLREPEPAQKKAEKSAPKRRTPKKKAAPAPEPAPAAKTARAELPAPAPETYSRESSGLKKAQKAQRDQKARAAEAKARREQAEADDRQADARANRDSRRRLDELVRRVTDDL